MKTRDVTMICASILAGLTLHGWITRPTPVAGVAALGSSKSTYTLNEKLLDIQPLPISIGGDTLIGIQLASVRDEWVDSRWDFFKYENGELKRVPFVEYTNGSAIKH